jgi:hypothetical protein
MRRIPFLIIVGAILLGVLYGYQRYSTTWAEAEHVADVLHANAHRLKAADSESQILDALAKQDALGPRVYKMHAEIPKQRNELIWLTPNRKYTIGLRTDGVVIWMVNGKRQGSDEFELFELLPTSQRKTTDATYWEWLRDDVPGWSELEYEWIATSCFGDQIVVVNNSPIHKGTAIYLLGPDVGGPNSNNPQWPENLIYLGTSQDEWLARVRKYGDEYSIAPGSIEDDVAEPNEYRRVYNALNPGLQW